MCWQMTQGPGLLEWAGHVPRGGPDLGAPGAPLLAAGEQELRGVSDS